MVGEKRESDLTWIESMTTRVGKKVADDGCIRRMEARVKEAEK